MNKESSLLLIVCLILYLSGCASLWEYPKVILGTSTRELQAARKDAISQEFNLSYEVAFKKTEGILKENSCKIFYKNRTKGIIVAMEFTGFINTSEVGIFLMQIEPAKTKVEVASQSQELAKVASKIIFPELNKLQQ